MGRDVLPAPALSRSGRGHAPAGRGMSAFLRIILRSSGPPVIRSRWPASGNFKICRDVRDVHIHGHTGTRTGKKWIWGNLFKDPSRHDLLSFFLSLFLPFSFFTVHQRERKST